MSVLYGVYVTRGILSFYDANAKWEVYKENCGFRASVRNFRLQTIRLQVPVQYQYPTENSLSAAQARGLRLRNTKISRDLVSDLEKSSAKLVAEVRCK